MKRKQTIFALLLALALLLSMVGCGASTKNAAPASGADTAASEPVWEDARTEEAAVPDEVTDAEWGETPALAEPGDPAPEPDASLSTSSEKIIYTAWLSLETTDFDRSAAALEAKIQALGGYIQSSSVNGNSRYNSDGTTSVVDRYATYTAAIPAAELENFLTAAGEAGNVLNLSRDAENITSQYTDTELRIESLKVQEERLLTMMKETGDLESLIALEQRLSEVTYEIESYQRALNDWDRRVAYSTVTVELQEVAVYTPTASVTRTFGDRLRDALANGWSSFIWFLQDLAVWVLGSLPALLLLAAAVFLAVRLVRKAKKRRDAKYDAIRKANEDARKQAETPREQAETPREPKDRD